MLNEWFAYQEFHLLRYYLLLHRYMRVFGKKPEEMQMKQASYSKSEKGDTAKVLVNNLTTEATKEQNTKAKKNESSTNQITRSEESTKPTAT